MLWRQGADHLIFRGDLHVLLRLWYKALMWYEVVIWYEVEIVVGSSYCGVKW